MRGVSGEEHWANHEIKPAGYLLPCASRGASQINFWFLIPLIMALIWGVVIVTRPFPAVNAVGVCCGAFTACKNS